MDFRFDNIRKGGGSSISLPLVHDSGTTPELLLDFARTDLGDGCERRCLENAVAHAKRALHLAVDLVSDATAIRRAKRFSEKKLIDFPTRVDWLTEIGVVAPNLLKRLNSQRNLIEHSYASPTPDDAATTVDVVDLFLAAISPLLRQFPWGVDAPGQFNGERRVMCLVMVQRSGQIWIGDGPLHECAIKARDLVSAQSSEVQPPLLERVDASSDYDTYVQRLRLLLLHPTR